MIGRGRCSGGADNWALPSAKILHMFHSLLGTPCAQIEQRPHNLALADSSKSLWLKFIGTEINQMPIEGDMNSGMKQNILSVGALN